MKEKLKSDKLESNIIKNNKLINNKKQVSKILKGNKGITLVALVITIIILLILAGIAISTLTGDNGLFSRAKQAKRETEIASIKEQIQTDIFAEQAGNEGNISEEKLTKILEKYGTLEGEGTLLEKTLKTKKGNYEIKVEDIFKGPTVADKEKQPVVSDKSGANKPNVDKIVQKTYITWDYDTEEVEKENIKKQIYTELMAVIEQTQNEVNDPEELTEELAMKIMEETLKKYGTLVGEGTVYEKTLKTTKGNYEMTLYDIILVGTKKEVLDEDIPVYKEVQSEQPKDGWYNYDNGKWANIKTTNNGLEAYWVWIPRYEYVVPTSTTATEIDVKFISTTKTTPDEGYIIHPAFTNEGNGGLGELDGIWVAKYEASSSDPSLPSGGGDDPNLRVQVKPLVNSWKYISPEKIFYVCRKMTETGGVLANSTVDSHLMKNTEWGAVAILSQSKYGIFSPESSTGENGDKTYKVWCNTYGGGANGENTCTGRSRKLVDSRSEETAVYNSMNGTKASTTGSVYGVYDMNGRGLGICSCFNVRKPR